LSMEFFRFLEVEQRRDVVGAGGINDDDTLPLLKLISKIVRLCGGENHSECCDAKPQECRTIRHDTRQDEVDDLLRNNVFVDRADAAADELRDASPDSSSSDRTPSR